MYEMIFLLTPFKHIRATCVTLKNFKWLTCKNNSSCKRIKASIVYVKICICVYFENYYSAFTLHTKT